MTVTDALEFMLVGARAIQIGTANFVDPASSVKILDGLSETLDHLGLEDVNEIVGALKTDGPSQDFST
jgi:dihydroorotate dehydrogenase (NAD+) catalytic subunit